MSNTSDTTRRAFLKVGAMAAVPPAGLGLPAAALAADGSKAELARMADQRELEGLTRQFVSAFNKGRAGGLAGGLPALDATRLHLADEAADMTITGDTASVRVACSAEQEEALEGDETLIRMARLQGNVAGVKVADKMLQASFTRHAQGWRIASIALS